MLRRPTKRFSLLAVLLAMVITVGTSIAPKPANAIFGFGDVVSVIYDNSVNALMLWQQGAAVVKKSIDTSVAVAFKQMALQFLGNATRELATQLATTQPGQKPLFLTNPKTFFRDVADAAAGDFIDTFTKGITGGQVDPRCNSTDPEVRKHCVGFTGGNTGLGNPTSGQRGRFIITALLRNTATATAKSCLTQCQYDFNVTDSDLKSEPNVASLAKSQDAATASNGNDHEIAVAILQEWLTTYIDKTVAADPNQTINCRDVVNSSALPAGTIGPALDDNWVFQFGSCRGDGASSDPRCMIAASLCKSRTEEAVNNERYAASKDASDCRTRCKTGATGALTATVKNATASDIFTYAQNFDIRRTPNLIASRFKDDTSDVGQYFQAAALLTATVETRVTGNQTYLNAGLLPRTASISDKILTPKEAGSALFGIPFYNSDGQLTFTGTGVADIIRAIASFVNSPVGRALFTYFKSHCGLNPDACSGPSNPTSVVGQILFGSGGATGIEAARIQYASLGQLESLNGAPGANDIDVLTQLTSNGLMDQQFRSAVDQQLTIQQALDQNLLNKDKIVGYDKNGIEPSSGYPFRSLQYMRKYRIIPIGWELAAKYNYNYRADDLTLGLLTKQYNICGQDTEHTVCSDTLDSCKSNSDCQNNAVCGASPYCGLVDPNWVLKAPQTFCRRQGAGEEIIAKNFVCDQNNVDKDTGNPIPNGTTCVAASTNTNSSDGTTTCHDTDPPNCVISASNPNPDIGHWVVTRSTDTCADSQSCLAENSDGTCIGYGYCVQERQTFKFDGNSCQAQNASCAAYTDSTGAQVGYLAKNLDTSCNADNAGCQWYCAEPSYDTAQKAWTCTANSGNKIYLTAKAQSCKAGDVGCREFIRIRPGTNFLPNGGFEYYDLGGGSVNADAAIDVPGWNAPSGSLYPVSADDADNTAGNQISMRVTTASDISQTVDIGSSLNDRAFSFSIRAKSPASCSASVTLCTGTDCASSSVVDTETLNPATNWQSFGARIVVPSEAVQTIADTHLTVVVKPGDCNNTGFVIDNAQLEEAQVPTDYVEYGTTNLVHLDGQRTYCSQADVGCAKYTAVDTGTVVNGIIKSSNLCAKGDVGCQYFHKEAITQLPQRDAEDTTIVASSGQQCSAADVGCEEYTNLDVVKQGGEGKAYFTNIKQCVTPTNPVPKSTFYTWMGDPTKGFVLHSQQLVLTNLGTGAPCTNLGVAKIDGTNPTNPTCADTATVGAVLGTADQATCSAADLADNPDCTEYYDSNLNVYYRLKSKTVSITADCHPYRNTIDETDPQYTANKGNVYFLSAQENRSCSAAAASCRAYTGSNSTAPRLVLKDTFEAIALSNWTGGQWSAASANSGGHSLQISLAAGQTRGVAFTKATTLTGKLQPGKSYVVSITAAAAAAPAAGAPTTQLRPFFGIADDGTGIFDENPSTSTALYTGNGAALPWNTAITPPGPEWHTFTFGPVTLGSVVSPDLRLALVVDNGGALIDTLSITEVSDHSYLINNSAPQCPASAVGCTAYKNTDNMVTYATAFSRLCSDQVVGCEAMIDTQNSVSPFEQTDKGVTTPADGRVVYVVNDPSKYCAASAKGCSMYGDPTFGGDNTVVSYKTVYKINDPDTYQGSMCLAAENGCNIYTNSAGTKVYFKDPSTQACDYRTSSSGSAGWYITGTNQKCPTAPTSSIPQPVGNSCGPVCYGGSRDGKACTIPGLSDECPGGGICGGDSSANGYVTDNTTHVTSLGQCSSTNSCAGTGRCSDNPTQTCTSDASCGGVARCLKNQCQYSVGTCPVAEDSCTEYRDPTDPESCQSQCPLVQVGGTPLNVDSRCARTYCISSDPNNQRVGQNCQNSDQCSYAGIPGTCVGLDGATPTTGAPGCRSYYYLSQSVASTAGDCNGKVDPSIGCRAFNNTSDPTLNFRGQ